jgi:hypothetical protein
LKIKIWKTKRLQHLAAVFVFQARAVCEWSHRWQTGSIIYDGWQLLAAKGLAGFLPFFAKSMTAPEPVATSRRAYNGQPVDCKLLKRMELEWNER